MRRATVESIIRWVSFGSSAMPRLPPLSDHEDPVDLDARLASLVEVDLVRVPREQSEPHIVRLRDGPSDFAAHLGPDPEVLEKRPVLVHAIPGRKRLSKRNERCGGDESSARALPGAPCNGWRRG